MFQRTWEAEWRLLKVSNSYCFPRGLSLFRRTPLLLSFLSPSSCLCLSLHVSHFVPLSDFPSQEETIFWNIFVDLWNSIHHLESLKTLTKTFFLFLETSESEMPVDDIIPLISSADMQINSEYFTAHTFFHQLLQGNSASALEAAVWRLQLARDVTSQKFPPGASNCRYWSCCWGFTAAIWRSQLAAMLGGFGWAAAQTANITRTSLCNMAFYKTENQWRWFHLRINLETVADK